MKIHLKYTLAALFLLLTTVAISACSNQPSANQTNPTDSIPTTTSSSQNIIKVSTVTVAGQSENILTDAKGLTLYYFTPDTSSTTACTGACAKTWPPLLSTGTVDVAASAQLPGKLSAAQNANGNQFQYNGHFLYTYASDVKPGDINGNDIGPDKWFIATTTLGQDTINAATATVDGKVETILTDAKGMSLYYFTPDTATKTACTNACAKTWPPLLFDGTGDIHTVLPGRPSVLKNDNGNQVQYNGHFLYTYSLDTKAGDVNGQGIGGKWFVATPDLSSAPADNSGS